MQYMYSFNFTQQVLGNKQRPCTYLRHTITAPHHLAAFSAWCRLLSIQELDMEQLGTLRIEVLPATAPSA